MSSIKNKEDKNYGELKDAIDTDRIAPIHEKAKRTVELISEHLLLHHQQIEFLDEN